MCQETTQAKTSTQLVGQADKQIEVEPRGSI